MKRVRCLRDTAMVFCLLFGLVLVAGFPGYSHAASAGEINISVDATLERFKLLVPGGAEFLQKAKGVLVFPTVIKAGFFVGGNMVKELCALVVKLLAITVQQVVP